MIGRQTDQQLDVQIRALQERAASCRPGNSILDAQEHGRLVNEILHLADVVHRRHLTTHQPFDWRPNARQRKRRSPGPVTREGAP